MINRFLQKVFVFSLIFILSTCKKDYDEPFGNNKVELAAITSDSISYFTVKIKSRLNSTGGNTITDHGLCWSLEPNPTISNEHKSNGYVAAPADISATLSSLQPGKKYFIRSYATIPTGTVYGAQNEFITLKTGVPIVKILSITALTATTAECNAEVISDSGSTVTVRGVCWSTTTNPSISDSFTTDGDGKGNFTSMLEGLNEGTTYYVKAYATNIVGTSMGNEVSFTTPYFTIGQNYGGGIIFYIDSTNQHGLICATIDQSIAAEWGCQSSTIEGADGTVIGTGAQNTFDIVNGCTTIGIAAEICYNLNYNGYNDWFLPSKDELELIYINLKVSGLGNFIDDNYWSSSEYSNNQVWFMYFFDGFKNKTAKNSGLRVRAVRKF